MQVEKRQTAGNCMIWNKEILQISNVKCIAHSETFLALNKTQFTP